jgi:hypothetical protein
VKVSKRLLAVLDGVYAVAAVRSGGATRLLAASEKRGPCLLFDPPDWKPREAWSGPGGTMNVTDVPGREDWLLAIQGFLPVFDAAGAGVCLALRGACGGWQVRRLFDLPYVHRIGVIRVADTLWLVAATLCGAKQHRDDWSSPGSVYACAIPELPDEPWTMAPILAGIHRNHGMQVTDLLGEPGVLIAGDEGLHLLRPPTVLGGTWQSTRLLDVPASDAWACDLFGDDVARILTIEPFHGNRLVLYEKVAGRWQPVSETGLEFGHAVWGGRIGGEACVLTGCRGGARELALLRMRGPSFAHAERIVLESGGGPTQIAVVPGSSGVRVLSANGASGEVLLHEIRF